MYKEYNAHPKGLKTSDCVVRAITTATNSDYLETRKILNRKKRELCYNTYKDTKFLYEYFQGYPRLIFKPIKGEPRIKGSDFTKLHPKGTFILKMTGHITACVDGVILDTWDCSYRSVYTAWEIKK
ncbi:hypothetical protein [Liberiplasma polymorphum]|uniref:hypothetical protein n=1 Tax=Liberiplasma polymorphum TaxID=3374570 RepID=UPI003774A1ED